jgi:hypothetical protein
MVTICHVRDRNDYTNPSDLTKVGTIPATSTDGIMTCIKGQDTSTLEDSISLYIEY